jgi:biotin carboxyl carrier protein
VKEMELTIDGKTYKVKVNDISGDLARVTVNGRELEVHLKQSQTVKPASPAPARSPAPSPAQVAKPSPAPRAAGGNSLAALMPGVVVRIAVGEGQEVAAGEVLLVLEAMKMENEIRSDRSGTISKVHVAVGQQVQTGEPLVSFS